LTLQREESIGAEKTLGKNSINREVFMVKLSAGRKGCACLLFILLVVGQALAQTVTGTITGTVTDPSGLVIAGAGVALHYASLHGKKQASFRGNTRRVGFQPPLWSQQELESTVFSQPQGCLVDRCFPEKNWDWGNLLQTLNPNPHVLISPRLRECD
jgi:hypothetical protein